MRRSPRTQFLQSCPDLTSVFHDNEWESDAARRSTLEGAICTGSLRTDSPAKKQTRSSAWSNSVRLAKPRQHFIESEPLVRELAKAS